MQNFHARLNSHDVKNILDRSEQKSLTKKYQRYKLKSTNLNNVLKWIMNTNYIQISYKFLFFLGHGMGEKMHREMQIVPTCKSVITTEETNLYLCQGCLCWCGCVSCTWVVMACKARSTIFHTTPFIQHVRCYLIENLVCIYWYVDFRLSNFEIISIQPLLPYKLNYSWILLWNSSENLEVHTRNTILDYIS